MTVRTSVLWKMKIHMAKKWPEKVVQRSFLKEHSFPNGLYNSKLPAKLLNAKWWLIKNQVEKEKPRFCRIMR